jgi:hypothetical protein
MRNVGVSTDVYAAIWAARREGEESEDEILRRLLGTAPALEGAAPAARSVGGGVQDSRTGVTFAEGFKVFRRYKGRDYSATATAGHWLRQDNGQVYPTLNQLNSSIVAGAENVWNGNWKFQAADGSTQSIAVLRR